MSSPISFCNATFRPQELEKERLVVIEELKNAEDDPEDIIHDYFEKAIFPDHSLGNPDHRHRGELRKFQAGRPARPPDHGITSRRAWSSPPPGTSTTRISSRLAEQIFRRRCPTTDRAC